MLIQLEMPTGKKLLDLFIHLKEEESGEERMLLPIIHKMVREKHLEELYIIIIKILENKTFGHIDKE